MYTISTIKNQNENILSFLLKHCTLIFCISFYTYCNSQTELTNGSLNTCSTILYDDGGPDADYSETSYTMTICPDMGDEFYLVVNQMDLGFDNFNDQDELIVYEGENTNGPVLFDNLNVNLDQIYQTSGCITITFENDPGFFETDVSAGFAIAISCEVPETCTDGILNNGEVNTDCGGINCPACWISDYCGDNLVYNGDFEILGSECETAPDHEIHVDYTLVDGWFGTSTSTGFNAGITPDYYNNNCVGNSTFPCHDGLGSLGFFISGEQVQSSLLSPLESGKEYCIKLSASTSSLAQPTSRLGIWFHNETFSNNTSIYDIDQDNNEDWDVVNGPVSAQPQFMNDPNNIIFNDCEDIFGSYCAEGGESTIVLGGFTDVIAESYIVVDNIIISESCPPDFDADIISDSSPDCEGSCAILTADVYNQRGGCEITNDFTFQWFEDGQEMVNETSQTLTVCPTGDVVYSVEINYFTGCLSKFLDESETTFEIICDTESELVSSVSDSDICVEECVSLSANLLPENDETTYTWVNVTTGVEIGNEPNFEVCPEENTTYQITAVFEGVEFTETIDVTVTEAYETTNDITICFGETYTEGSTVYTESGTYIEEYGTISQCDSIIITNLEILDEIVTINEVSICTGQSYEEGSSSYTESGVYEVVYTSISGCDSLVITDLTVSDVVSITNIANICEGESYVEGSSEYTESGVYEETYQIDAECDSVVTTVLTVHSSTVNNSSVSICEGQTYTEGNFSYSESGTYELDYTSIFGCDSTIVLELLVNNSYESLESLTLCEGEEFPFTENISMVSENQYLFTGETSNGCDSLIYYNVMFDTLPDLDFTLSQEEGCVPINLTLNNNNFIQDFNYSWILTDAESYTALADTSFVIEEEGIYNYSLQVQSNLDCSDISNMSFEAFQPEFFNSGLGSIQTCSPLNLNFDLAANMNQDFQDVSWEIDDFGIISESNQINYSINTAGNYDLELSGSYIDSNNCTTEFFESIPIEVLPNPEANFELNSDEFNVGTEYLFTNTSLNSTTQSWIFQSQTETFYSIEENPVVTFNDGPANYQITLYAQNEGCSDSLTLNVFVNNELFLYVPNSFTPNGDDINEIFTPIIKNNDPGLEYNFSIYNRWGQKIFESNKLGEGWNGASSINGDYYAQNGVYTWVLILNSSNLFSQLYTGSVTLLR